MMDFLTRLLDSAGAGWLIGLICLLIPIGSQFAQRSPSVADWGIRLAVAISLIFTTITLADEGLQDSRHLFTVVLRAVAVGTVLVGPFWIILSVLSFFRDRYCQLLDLLRAQGQLRQAARLQRRQAAEQRARQQQADRDWERARPEREQQAREAEVQKLLQAARQAELQQQLAVAQSRRENVRAACELLYSQYAPELQRRFPRSEFNRLLHSYLADSHPADDVERRGRDLQQLILQQRDLVSTEEAPDSMSGLAKWYLKEKERINRLNLDEDLKQTHRMQLDFRYAELSEELLNKAQP